MEIYFFFYTDIYFKAKVFFCLRWFYFEHNNQFFFTVGYDVTYYNYLWIREPHLKTELHLDNHDVHISAFDFVAIKEDRQFPGLGVKVKLKRHLGKIYIKKKTQFFHIIWKIMRHFPSHLKSWIVDFYTHFTREIIPQNNFSDVLHFLMLKKYICILFF